jgi:hypothetical protein
MKKIKTIFAILFIVLLTISCSNDDDSSTQTIEGYFFKAKINGNPFSATIPEFGASKSGNIITIACVQGIHKFQLKITNPIDNGVGAYTIPTTSNTIILTYENDVVVYISGNCSTTGNLNITAIENNQIGEISGTFSFTAGNSDDCALPQINITEGSFKAIYAGS